MVREPEFADTAVVINEFGSVGVDHHLVRHVDDGIAVVEGGCICCMVRGGLTDTLRDLFLLALRRAVKPFRRLVIETSGLASPAPILFTLRHEHFLAERYAYNGTIAVADSGRIARQLALQPEAAQQIALADEIVMSKVGQVGPGVLDAAQEAVRDVNPTANLHVLRDDAQLPPALLAERLYRPARAGAPDASGAGWLGAYKAPATGRAPHEVAAVTVIVEPPPRRAAFLRGMAELQEQLGESLLRVKGLVQFEGDPAPYAVHGVHRELYPLLPLAAWPDEDTSSRLVFIARGPTPAALDALARRCLGLGLPQ
jgi:G3E family GTPase